MFERIDWLRSLIVGGALLFGACTAGASPGATTGVAAEPTRIAVEGFLFVEDEVRVSPGETVRWENRDRILHTVTAGTPDAPVGLFDGSLPDQGSTFEFTPTEAGSYEYFCSRHPHMTGVVIVE